MSGFYGGGGGGMSIGALLSGGTVGALLEVDAGPVLGQLIGAATGKVLVSGGVGAPPVYSDSPTIKDLTLSGQLHTKQGADVASATTLTLAGGNDFIITSNTTIQGILTTGHNDGDFVVLKFYHTSSGPLLVHASGAPGTNAKALMLRGNVNWQTTGFSTGNEVILLQLSTRNGVEAWWEIARSNGLDSQTPGFTMVANGAGTYLIIGSTAYNPGGIVATNNGGPYDLSPNGTTTGFRIKDTGGAALMTTSGAGATARALFDGLLKFPTANTQTTIGGAGGGSALPATPTRYLIVDVNGTQLGAPLYPLV